MLSTKFVPDEKEVLEIVKNDLGGGTIEIVGFNMEKASTFPMGFLGDHGRLKVNLRRGEEFIRKIYFVKKLPENAPLRVEYLRKLRCFYKEIGLYTRVFVELRKTRPVLAEWHPKCLFAREDDLIVLEDLTQMGYYMYPERKLMDEEHLLCSLRALASMHASSIIYQEKLPQAPENPSVVGDVFSEYLFETTYNSEEGHPAKRDKENAIYAQLKIVDLLDGYSDNEKETIKRELPIRLKRLFSLIKPSQKFQNVIVHGDLWSNNLMFLKDDCGRVKEAKIIDFQLARYGPPAQDIMTFLHLVQTKDFREQNQLKLLRHYYDALSHCLGENGIRTEDFITWYELLGTCDYYQELGIVTAIFFFQLILAPVDIRNKLIAPPEAMTVDLSEIVVECFSRDYLYRERVTEAMNELIKEYIL